jgi:hypothetical protein
VRGLNTPEATWPREDLPGHLSLLLQSNTDGYVLVTSVAFSSTGYLIMGSFSCEPYPTNRRLGAFLGNRGLMRRNRRRMAAFIALAFRWEYAEHARRRDRPS